MENKYEVKVNIINQLKLLRQSTFKDKLAFLDEDIQNAQRAKAGRVDVRVDQSKKTVTIENDGQILENPQALFSIAESEWDEDVQRTESPFGMGFFSNITVSDHIEIFTGFKHITFDIGNMIQENRTDIKVEEIEEYYNGFMLILHNFNFVEISRQDIKERVELLGRYVHSLDIYHNDVIQQKRDLTEGDGSQFIVKVTDDPTFQGWIALNKSSSQDLKVFYKGRLVTKINDFYYIKGDLHVTDKTLNLTAPDRKDIIIDGKYTDFKSAIREYIKNLCLDSFLGDDQYSIEEFIDPITYYIEKSKLKNNMKFLTFDGDDEEDIKYLHKIAHIKKKDSDVKSLNDVEVYVRSEAARQSESILLEINIEENVKNLAPSAQGTEYYGGGYSSGHTTKPEIDESYTIEREAKEFITNDEPVFWLKFDDIVEHEKKFNIAKHYGLKIIVARNKLEASMLEMMGREQNLLHIKELTESTIIKASLSNMELGLQEQRALMLLDMISRIVGFDRNVFALGDLMVTKETNFEAIDKKHESIEDQVVAIYSSENEKIYVDRSIIDKSKLRTTLDEDLNIDDYKFLIMHLKDIVDELALMEFKDNKNLFKNILQTLAVA